MSLLISVVSDLHPEPYCGLPWIDAMQVHAEVILTLNSHSTLQLPQGNRSEEDNGVKGAMSLISARVNYGDI